MKKIISFFVLILAFGFMNAQENFELSTLRIGPYKIFMDKKEAEKIAGTPLKVTDGDKKNNVKYNGELIGIQLYSGYGGEANPDGIVITGMTTTSKKFKTKSGMGIGNTKDELINAYRNYPHFNVNPAYDEQTGKSLKQAGYFTLEDDDAGTQLIFKLTNNIVTEITVYINEGC
ncbi:hypothetical protein P2W68_21660 [Chryseobacterium arthrosphaerae]|uniref:hypothetical protein n=1 Tax=Chryseobacterium arthrosphaerae TaxID=651561 RepID=UPI0023E2890D|nr:hypothetical protein [Chryseobacterium arthrosphaerae]WES97406.1 hypothetical protein P2W68_21660 [Chryseobacterium arthrosphaerae]